jgi:serine-type D-Ala-D-Ala carboxypeptidase (penicillin-binding protein 5/6)
MGISIRLAAAAAVIACVIPAADLAATPLAHASVRAAAAPAGVVALAGELVNVTTGSRMWSRDKNTELPIASITKVMTAMVVLAHGDLNRKIRVTEAAESYAQENSAGTAGLHPGDVLTARQLLQGLLLPSGADAAYLLARSYGPSWRAFVRKMNATARRLGMTQTHFANFDGLPWPTEYSTYSTPRDLIILGKAAMQNRVFRRMVAERSHRIAATSQHHRYFWKNTNLLLRRYRGTIGIKTGFTLAAGYCLLFEAKRHGQELMGVVLDSTNTDTTMRFTAAARLLNWGFAHDG